MLFAHYVSCNCKRWWNGLCVCVCVCVIMCFVWLLSCLRLCEEKASDEWRWFTDSAGNGVRLNMTHAGGSMTQHLLTAALHSVLLKQQSTQSHTNIALKLQMFKYSAQIRILCSIIPSCSKSKVAAALHSDGVMALYLDTLNDCHIHIHNSY